MEQEQLLRTRHFGSCFGLNAYTSETFLKLSDTHEFKLIFSKSHYTILHALRYNGRMLYIDIAGPASVQDTVTALSQESCTTVSKRIY